MIDRVREQIANTVCHSLEDTRLIRELKYRAISSTLRAIAWVRQGRKYRSPVRPDRILWITPHDIRRKSVNKLPSHVIKNPIILGGSWDQNLTNIRDDIVYEAFYDHFVDGKSWKETDYIDFLQTDISEHGNVSREDAMKRCEKLDQLYESIRETGYKTQAELEREGALVGGLTNTVVPPKFREITVNITREGEFLWNGGMHRLVITQLLNIEKIPVRIHIRHERWQSIRESVYTGNERPTFHDHEDVQYLVNR